MKNAYFIPTQADLARAVHIPNVGTISLADVHAERARRGIAYSGWWLSEGTFTRARHLQYLSDRITPLLIQGSARIIVCAPPRHAKSSLVSEQASGWFLNRWPERRVIETCYGDTFAASWGMKVRDLLVANQAKTQVRIARGANAATDVGYTTKGGGMKTAGVGTGRSATYALASRCHGQRHERIG